MNDELTYTQFDSRTYLDSDYELVQEQLAFDWLEPMKPYYAYEEDDVFCDVCGDFYPVEDQCRSH